MFVKTLLGLLVGVLQQVIENLPRRPATVLGIGWHAARGHEDPRRRCVRRIGVHQRKVDEHIQGNVRQPAVHGLQILIDGQVPIRLVGGLVQHEEPYLRIGQRIEEARVVEHVPPVSGSCGQILGDFHFPAGEHAAVLAPLFVAHYLNMGSANPIQRIHYLLLELRLLRLLPSRAVCKA